MRKKWLPIAVCSVLCISMLTACGDGEGDILVALRGTTASGILEEQDSKESETATDNTQESNTHGDEGAATLTPEAAVMLKLETKYSTDGLTVEEYKELAQVYAQTGRYKKQRDMLEQCWRLYGDGEAFSTLQDITVNVHEESDALRAQAELLMQNLDIPEYRNEAASVIYSRDWFNIMMPKLKEGKRSYYCESPDTDSVLVWQTGYDDAGQGYTNAWYCQGEEMIILQQTPESIRMIMTRFVQGKYQGAFTSWLCLSPTESVYYETGNLIDNVLTGDYMIQIHKGKESADLIALWATREELEFTDYKGSFNQDGTIAVKQPEAKSRNNKSGEKDDMDQLIYAYTENEKNYLFLNVPEGTEVTGVTFDTELLGIPAYPDFNFYAPVRQQETGEVVKDKQINALDVQIRIYDSNLEWFDGTRWYTLGSVADFIAQDPLVSYEGRQDEVPEDSDTDASGEANGAAQDTEVTLTYEEIGQGAIKQQTTTKPSTSTKPQVKPRPTPQPTPQPEPEPEPEPEPVPPTSEPSAPPESGDSGNSEGKNEGEDNNNSEGGSSGGGNDTDAEWGPDLLS